MAAMAALTPHSRWPALLTGVLALALAVLPPLLLQREADDSRCEQSVAADRRWAEQVVQLAPRLRQATALPFWVERVAQRLDTALALELVGWRRRHPGRDRPPPAWFGDAYRRALRRAAIAGLPRCQAWAVTFPDGNPAAPSMVAGTGVESRYRMTMGPLLGRAARDVVDGLGDLEGMAVRVASLFGANSSHQLFTAPMRGRAFAALFEGHHALVTWDVVMAGPRPVAAHLLVMAIPASAPTLPLRLCRRHWRLVVSPRALARAVGAPVYPAFLAMPMVGRRAHRGAPGRWVGRGMRSRTGSRLLAQIEAGLGWRPPTATETVGHPDIGLPDLFRCRRLDDWRAVTVPVHQLAGAVGVLLSPVPREPPRWMDRCRLAWWVGGLLLLGGLGVAALLGGGRPAIGVRMQFGLWFFGLAAIPLAVALGAGERLQLDFQQREVARVRRELLADVERIDVGLHGLQDRFAEACRRQVRDPGRWRELLAIQDRDGDWRPVVARIGDGCRADGLSLLGVMIWGHGAYLCASFSSELDLACASATARIHGALAHELLGRLEPELARRRAADVARRRGQVGSVVALSGFQLGDANKKVLARPDSVQPFEAGARQMMRYFNVVRLDGRAQFVVFMIWDQVPLVRPRLRDAVAAFDAAKTGHDLAAFTTDRNRLEALGCVGHGERLRRTWELVGVGIREFADERMVMVGRGSPVRPGTLVTVSASIEPIVAGVAARARQAVAALAGLLAFLFAVGWALAGWLTKPVVGLSIDLRAVAGDGDLSRQLAIPGRTDEIGTTAAALDQMVAWLRERQTMSRFVSPQVLQVVAGGDIAAASRGTRRRVVLLSSDVRSFTTLSERYAPTAIFALINQHLQRMTPIIQELGGVIDRFIGDAIQAVFYPGPGEPMELRALRAGWGMMREHRRLNHERLARGEFPYRIGVGLAIGEMVVGVVGDPDVRLDLTVLGDGFRHAADLEAESKKAPVSQIVCAAALTTTVSEKFSFSRLGELDGEPCYELVAGPGGEPLPPHPLPHADGLLPVGMPVVSRESIPQCDRRSESVTATADRAGADRGGVGENPDSDGGAPPPADDAAVPPPLAGEVAARMANRSGAWQVMEVGPGVGTPAVAPAPSPAPGGTASIPASQAILAGAPADGAAAPVGRPPVASPAGLGAWRAVAALLVWALPAWLLWVEDAGLLAEQRRVAAAGFEIQMASDLDITRRAFMPALQVSQQVNIRLDRAMAGFLGCARRPMPWAETVGAALGGLASAIPTLGWHLVKIDRRDEAWHQDGRVDPARIDNPVFAVTPCVASGGASLGIDPRVLPGVGFACSRLMMRQPATYARDWVSRHLLSGTFQTELIIVLELACRQFLPIATPAGPRLFCWLPLYDPQLWLTPGRGLVDNPDDEQIRYRAQSNAVGLVLLVVDPQALGAAVVAGALIDNLAVRGTAAAAIIGTQTVTHPDWRLDPALRRTLAAAAAAAVVGAPIAVAGAVGDDWWVQTARPTLPGADDRPLTVLLARRRAEVGAIISGGWLDWPLLLWLFGGGAAVVRVWWRGPAAVPALRVILAAGFVVAIVPVLLAGGLMLERSFSERVGRLEADGRAEVMARLQAIDAANDVQVGFMWATTGRLLEQPRVGRRLNAIARMSRRERDRAGAAFRFELASATRQAGIAWRRVNLMGPDGLMITDSDNPMMDRFFQYMHDSGMQVLNPESLPGGERALRQQAMVGLAVDEIRNGALLITPPDIVADMIQSPRSSPGIITIGRHALLYVHVIETGGRPQFTFYGQLLPDSVIWPVIHRWHQRLAATGFSTGSLGFSRRQVWGEILTPPFMRPYWDVSDGQLLMKDVVEVAVPLRFRLGGWAETLGDAVVEDEGEEAGRILHLAMPARTLGDLILHGTWPMGEELARVGSAVGQRRVWLAVILGLTVMLALVTARQVLRPLLDLEDAAHRITRGDFSVRIRLRRADEFGELANAFDAMAARVEEGRLLSRFVSESVRLAAKAGERAAEAGRGEMREAVVIFAGLAGFKEQLHALAPEDLVDRLNRHLRRMSAVIRAEGGEIDKFIGDKILAVFPIDDEVGPWLAMAAAMRAADRMWQASLAAGADLAGMRFGAGVVAGPVLAGVLGDPEVRLEYTVLGDTVNLAARLCDLAQKLDAAGRLASRSGAVVAGGVVAEAGIAAGLSGPGASVPVREVAGIPAERWAELALPPIKGKTRAVQACRLLPPA